MTASAVTLTGTSLGLDEVVRVARSNEPVAIAPAALDRIAAACVLDLAAGYPVRDA